MALKAILALLLIHILSVARYGYSSLQDNCRSDDKHRTKLDSSFKSGFAIGFVISSVSILTIFMSYCVPWARLNKRKRNKVMKKTPLMTSLMARREKKIKEANIQMQISMPEKMIRRVSFVALKKATGSFDRDYVIGVGKTGTMYKAALPYDCFTAVKRLHNTAHSEKRFKSEVIILSRCKHVNLLSLLGICTESKERILVYKYVPNGNLYDWLHPVKGEAKILGWRLRIKIAVGIASGLAWIQNYIDFQVVHRKISSSCILLDKYFEPKISNFGGAILFKDSNAKGFPANSKVGELDLMKRDVYQFGILLLELVTGEDPANNSEFYRTLEEIFVQNHGLSTVSSSLYSAADKSLLGQGFDCQVLNFLKVASTCIQPIPDRRPTMIQVHKMLMAVRNNDGLSTDPEILGQTDIVSSDSSDDSFGLEITEVK